MGLGLGASWWGIAGYGLVSVTTGQQVEKASPGLRVSSLVDPHSESALVMEKIVSTMQMRSESASHADNFYVDNLP